MPDDRLPAKAETEKPMTRAGCRQMGFAFEIIVKSKSLRQSVIGHTVLEADPAEPEKLNCYDRPSQ